MITGIKDLDDQLLRIFENTYTCSLVCKDWNNHMNARKTSIKSSIAKGIEMYIGNFNKQIMLNYKTKKPQALNADWINNISEEVKQCNRTVFITRKCISLDIDLKCISDINENLNLKDCCVFSYRSIKKICALFEKKAL